MTRRITMFIIALGLLVTPALQAADESQVIKLAPASQECMQTLDGELLYQELCSVCHGVSGVGNGPAAKLLQVPPTNLTLLTSNNPGKFPARRVQQWISGQHHETVAGSEMPGWENILGRSTGNEIGARLRVYNLTQYVKGIQVAGVDTK